jgi:hypothetical protein
MPRQDPLGNLYTNSYAPPTYYALADNIAPAANAYVVSLLNNSANVITVKKLFLIDNALGAVTGVAVRADLMKCTAVASGTDITAIACDSKNPAVPATVVIQSLATVTASGILFPITFTNDEVGATQAFPNSTLLAGFNWMPEGQGLQGVRLNKGEGITLKHITNSTIGTFSYLLVFTMETE